MNEKNKITINPKNSVFSGHELVIIPKDPKFKPNDSQIKSSLEILERLYPSCKINSELFDSIIFADQGQNFESVTCNLCMKELSIDFWQEKMSESFDNSHFEDMYFQTVCCNKETNLNDLNYQGDCGFASYTISINNAEPDDIKENELITTLSNAMGINIKLFWRHI